MALKSSSTGTISGASSLTIAHTVPAGSDRIMIVMASGLNSADPLAAATVTYGGVSLGSPVVTASEALPSPSGNNYVYAWTLLAPTVGTANVVITCAAGGYVDAIVCTIDGAAQAAPAAKAARTSSFEASPATLAISGTGRQVVDFICNRAVSKTMTPAGGQTRIGTAIAGGISSSTGSYASNVTAMEWTHPDSGAANISRAILAFDAASGGSPPTLSSPTGTKTGTTTATGTVTTTETGGTLYYRATTNASESGSTVKAGSSITVDALNESVSLTGLTAGQTYYLHYLHTGANGDSSVASSASFTTDAASSNGTFTSGTLARNNDAAAGASLSWVTFLNKTTGAHVLTKTSVALTAGVFTVTDAALVAGTEYHATWREAGGQIGWGLAVAS